MIGERAGESGLGERGENVAILRHNLACDRHLVFEVVNRFVGNLGQLKTPRSSRHCKPIPDSRAEMVEDLLRQDDPGGLADLGDLKDDRHAGSNSNEPLAGQVQRIGSQAMPSLSPSISGR